MVLGLGRPHLLERGRAISDEERAFIMWGDIWELLCCAKPVVCFGAKTILRTDQTHRRERGMQADRSRF